MVTAVHALPSPATWGLGQAGMSYSVQNRSKNVWAQILTHPKCSYTVSWRKSIRHVVLGYSFWSRLLALPREEFWISKLTFHSDLRRRAASHLALPCPSSLYFWFYVKQLAACCVKSSHQVHSRLCYCSNSQILKTWSDLAISSLA